MHPELKKIIVIDFVKYMDVPGLAELCLLSEHESIPWLEGFYAAFIQEEHYDSKSSSLFIHVPSVYYSPGDYHKYIKIDMGTREQEFEDEYPKEASGKEYIIRVIKYEPYELGDVSKAILDKIKHLEECRKK